MARTCRSRLLTILFILGGLTASGCGGAVKPKGQLLMNGQPYRLGDGEKVSISFTPEQAGKTAASAAAAQDGSFEVQGEGLQPGSYAISVISTNSKAPGADRYKDKFNNDFKGASSPLKVDVASGSAPSITIDLGARTVGKK